MLGICCFYVSTGRGFAGRTIQNQTVAGKCRARGLVLVTDIAFEAHRIGSLAVGSLIGRSDSLALLNLHVAGLNHIFEGLSFALGECRQHVLALANSVGLARRAGNDFYRRAPGKGGNAIVVKPATPAPALTLELAKALAEAGLPKGALNVVIGEGRTVGAELATNSAVAALSFTGSYPVGNQIYQQLAQRMARAQMEMGGKNPTIVLADADLDLAATLVAKAGFGLTGQACTATSRAIVERSVLEPFTEKLIAKARALKIGNGLTPGVEMGPAVSKQQLASNIDYIDSAVAQGAQLLYGGQRLTDGEFANGHFMQPTVLGNVRPDMRIACEEVFGPVIAVMPAQNFEEALKIANGVDVGLSASVVTRDLKKAMLYAERIEAGVVKINQISTGLALQAPFGGVKKSSSDSFKEQGASAIEFYSRVKTVYLDYSA